MYKVEIWVVETLNYEGVLVLYYDLSRISIIAHGFAVSAMLVSHHCGAFVLSCQSCGSTWTQERGTAAPGPARYFSIPFGQSLESRTNGLLNEIGLPLLGNALDLAACNSLMLIDLYRKWASAYGPITLFRIMGKQQVILSDDKKARELFVGRGNIYSSRDPPHAVQYISMNQNPGFRPKDGEYETFLAANSRSFRALVLMIADSGLASSKDNDAEGHDHHIDKQVPGHDG